MVGFKQAKKAKKSKKSKPTKQETKEGEITPEELPDIVKRLTSEIHRRMEMTWRATGERECPPSFLEMDAVRVLNNNKKKKKKKIKYTNKIL